MENRSCIKSSIAIIVSNNAKCDIALCGEAVPVNCIELLQCSSWLRSLVERSVVRFRLKLNIAFMNRLTSLGCVNEVRVSSQTVSPIEILLI